MVASHLAYRAVLKRGGSCWSTLKQGNETCFLADSHNWYESIRGRDVLELTEAIKIKFGETEAYISEIEVWDRRCIGFPRQASGVLLGHIKGITFIDSRGDGHHLISNGKDQAIKLWDIRKMSSNLNQVYYHKNTIWDYRWMDFPDGPRHATHPNDSSLATYKGHSVLRTLIRCYFSPEFSTGKKYIYTGSADGSVYVYDIGVDVRMKEKIWDVCGLVSTRAGPSGGFYHLPNVLSPGVGQIMQYAGFSGSTLSLSWSPDATHALAVTDPFVGSRGTRDCLVSMLENNHMTGAALQVK